MSSTFVDQTPVSPRPVPSSSGRWLAGRQLTVSWWACRGSGDEPFISGTTSDLVVTLHRSGSSWMLASGQEWLADPLTAVLVPGSLADECIATPTVQTSHVTTVRIDHRAAMAVCGTDDSGVTLAPAPLRLVLLLQAFSQLPVGDLPDSVHRDLEAGVLRWLRLCRADESLRPIDRGVPLSYRMAVDKARALMGRHAAEPLTVAQIAAHCRFSQYYFSRVFRNLTGFPVYGYLKRLRLVAAGDRLLATREPIGRIAKAVGFTSHSHLTATFSQTYGVAPARVRRFVADQDPAGLMHAIGWP